MLRASSAQRSHIAHPDAAHLIVQAEGEEELATHLLDAAPGVVLEQPGLRLWHRALAVNRLPKVAPCLCRSDHARICSAY